MWGPVDVLLVVEVSDETAIQDLNVKTRVYGATGYRTRVEYRIGERIPVRYAGAELPVEDLLTDAG